MLSIAKLVIKESTAAATFMLAHICTLWPSDSALNDTFARYNWLSSLLTCCNNAYSACRYLYCRFRRPDDYLSQTTAPLTKGVASSSSTIAELSCSATYSIDSLGGADKFCTCSNGETRTYPCHTITTPNTGLLSSSSPLAFDYRATDIYGPDDAIIACKGTSVDYWGANPATVGSPPQRDTLTCRAMIWTLW